MLEFPVKFLCDAWSRLQSRAAENIVLQQQLMLPGRIRAGFLNLLTVAATAGVVAVCSTPARAQDFIVCESTFALCTTAACEPIPGNTEQVACHCTVNRGYSAGQEECSGVKDTAEGQQIRSRYYPVHSYAICSNDRPWAWCLDRPCLIDKNNPQAASCVCDAVKKLGDYVIVTSNVTSNTCTTGVISSATVQQITQITDYIRTKAANKLTAFKIEVLSK
jgi:hypothetical protein